MGKGTYNMIKNFVLDTNVLLDDEDCISRGFGDNNIIIPMVVLEELGAIKKDKGNRGFLARSVLRDIEEISKK